MRLAFLLLIALPLAFAQVGYSIVPAGAMIGVLIVALAYMAANVLQNSQMEAWAKSEWKELIISGLIVFFVYGAVSAHLGQILWSTTGYPDSSSLVTMVEGRFGTFENDLYKDYYDVIRVAQRLGMITSYSYTATGGYIFYMGKMDGPYIGTSGLMQSLAILSGNLSNGILVYEAMILFLKFFFQISAGVILPLGLALRFLPFTRKAAATIIGLALAGIFLYPIAMVLAAEIHDNIGVQHSLITPSDLDRITIKLPQDLVQMCTNDAIRSFTQMSEWGWWAAICTPYCLISCAGPQFAACFPPCFMPIKGTCWNAISYPFYNWVQTGFMVGASISLVSASQAIENAIGTDPGVIFDIINNHLVIPLGVASSLPIMEAVFVAAITIVGARSLSAALGGEIAIVGLERLV